MSKKYKVKLSFIYEAEVIVEADSEDDAIYKARDEGEADEVFSHYHDSEAILIK